MDRKYFVFEPWRGGIGNVIMSYECALALSYITNRTLILPPTLHLGHITNGIKEQNPKYWDLFDEAVTKKEFDIVEYFDHDDFKNHHDELQTAYSWIQNIDQVFPDSYVWFDKNSAYQMTEAHTCFVNDIPKWQGTDDFEKFSSGRNLVDLNRNEKYLIFKHNLFQNFWFMAYPGPAVQRNTLKKKVNNSVRYHQKYYDLFEQLPMSRVQNYNAVHIRRNDFFVQFAYALTAIDQKEKLVSQFLRVFDPNKPLYITTDEKDLTFFDTVKQVYKEVYIGLDVYKDFNNLEQAILDQITCSRADIFYGIQNSTFSRRINIMRGLEGRPAHDNMGINNLDSPGIECGNFPWLERHDQQWSWNQSAYLQWTIEAEN